MDEQEARTKWCPMANIAAVGSHGYNRDTVGDPADKSFCITFDCMMWRSRERSHCSLTACPKLGFEHPCIKCKWNVIEFKGEGFCGLGGKP